LLRIEIVIWLVALVTSLLEASSIATCTGGLNAAPVVVFVGCAVNTNCVAVPATLNALLAALVSVGEEVADSV
jgi:hypothetical protein